MADIKQLSVLLGRQTDAIHAEVTYPAISKPLQQKTINKITKSPHTTPHIIENDEGSITPVHRVISHQYKLRPQIIPPETPHPRRMEKIYTLHIQGHRQLHSQPLSYFQGCLRQGISIIFYPNNY